MKPFLTVVVPTIGRHTLPRTLKSLRRREIEVIVVADTCGMMTDTANMIESISESFDARYLELDTGFHDIGSSQLQLGYQEASGRWIANMGDDDVMEPYTLSMIADASHQQDSPHPMMFRVVLHPTTHRGEQKIPIVLWHTPVIEDSYVTGQSFVIPNDQGKIGIWTTPKVDVGFMRSTVDLYGGEVDWRTEVITQCY